MSMIEPHICREQRKVQARRRRLVHGANTAAARPPQNHRDLTCRWPTRNASRCSSRFGIDVGRALPCGFRVELRGFEPLTPTLPVWCATNCAIAPEDVLIEV